jgi:hypothetical protein
LGGSIIGSIGVEPTILKLEDGNEVSIDGVVIGAMETVGLGVPTGD